MILTKDGVIPNIFLYTKKNPNLLELPDKSSIFATNKE